MFLSVAPSVFPKKAAGGGAAPSFKSQLRVFIDPTDASTITGSPVSVITDPRASGFTTKPRFLQSTSGNRPAITAGRLVFDGSNDLMDESSGYSFVAARLMADPAYAQAGKGPTCTGLARAGDGTFWVGHFGKKNETTAAGETFQGSLCQYSADFSTLVREITFASLSLANVGIQGVAIDTTNGYLYCCDVQNSRIYGINPAGPSLVYNFAYTNANAIAYNSIADELIVCGDSARAINRVNKTTGSTLGLLVNNRDTTAPDHFFFDASYGASGALYVTSRTNNVAGRVLKYDMASPFNTLKSWLIDEAQCIEGVVVVGDTIYLCDDEYYHNGSAGVNRIVQVTADTATPEIGSRLVMAGVAKVTGAGASSSALVTGSDGIGQKGAGIYFNTTPGLFRLIARGSAAQGTADFTITPVSATTAEFIYCADLDMGAQQATLWINGMLISTLSIANFTGNLPNLVWTLGASYENGGLGRWLGCTIGGFMTTTNPDIRQPMEGYLAHATGNAGLLPGGHPYKSAPPA